MNLEKLKTTTLIILIVISAVLTYFLWTFQPNYEQLHNLETVEKVTLADERPLNEVFVPIQLFYHAEEEHKGMYNQNEFAPFYELLLDARFDNFATHSLNNQLNHLIAGNESIQFVYADGISMEVFHQLFDFSREKPVLSHVERIVLFEQERGNRVKTFAWFVSNKTNSYIEAEIQNQTFQAYKDLFEQRKENFLDVEEIKLGSKRIPLFFPKKEMTVHKQQAYPVPIPELDLTRALFPDPSLVRESYQEEDVRSYTDGSRELKLYLQAHYLTYINPTRRGEHSNFHEESPILQTHRFINSHGGFTESFIFFGAAEQTENKTQVDYRLSFKGHPAFDARITQMKVIWQEREVFEYERATETISDSISIQDSETVTLLSAEQLLDVLKQSSLIHENEIDNITLGYTASKYDDYIVFAPNWYICFNGRWEVVLTEKDG